MSAATLRLPIELDELRRIFKKHGVVSASVFGSCARGEAHEDSGLDLLVRLESGRSAFDLVDLPIELEHTAHRKVDIATKLLLHFEPYITPDLTPIQL